MLQAVRSPAMAADIFFIRQPYQRGLGDAIRLARGFVGDEPFAVLLPDELFVGERPALGELLDVFAELGRTVVGYKEIDPALTGRYGIIDPEEIDTELVRARDLVEKPGPGEAPSNLAIVGRYVIEPSVFQHLNALKPGAGGELQLTDALRQLARDPGVYGCALTAQRYDVGTPVGYLAASVEFALRRPDLAGPMKEFLRSLAAGWDAASKE